MTPSTPNPKVPDRVGADPEVTETPFEQFVSELAQRLGRQPGMVHHVRGSASQAPVPGPGESSVVLDSPEGPIAIHRSFGPWIRAEQPGRSRYWIRRARLQRKLGPGPRKIARIGRALFGPGLASTPGKARLGPLERTRQLLRLERDDIAVLLVYAVALGIIALSVPVTVQAIVNTVAFGSLLQPVVVLTLLLSVVLTLGVYLHTMQYRVVEMLQRRVFVRIVAELVSVLQRAHPGALRQAGGAELLNRFFDLFTAKKALSSLLLGGLDAALVVLVGLLLLAAYDPALLVFDVIVIVAACFVFLVLGRGGTRTAIAESKAKYEIADALQAMASDANETLTPTQTEHAVARADVLASTYLGKRASHFTVVQRQFVGTLVLQASSTVGLLALGGYLVIERRLSLGQLVAAELVVTAVVMSVAKLGSKIEPFFDLLAALDKLGQILDLPAAAQKPAQARTLPFPDNGPNRIGHDSSYTKGLATPPALLVPSPGNARRVARGLVVALVLFAFIAAAAPFRQTVAASGNVVAFSPNARRQGIEAPVSGRVARWHVREGSHVKAGDPLVELEDNDALLLGRLGEERSALSLRLATQDARVVSLQDRLVSLRRLQQAHISWASAEVDISVQKLSAARQALAAALANREVNTRNLDRQQDLHSRGLTSQRDLELAELAWTTTGAQVSSEQAAVQGAESQVEAKRAQLNRERAAATAELHNAQASLQDAKSDVATMRAALVRTDIGVSRQAEQVVTAPMAGTILRIVVRQGSEQVSQGDVLAVIVPDSQDRAVELLVDGNGASLLQPGDLVRLQFEGWPALQFAGWPSVAVGTFGGEVAFVDPADNGHGDFRVVVQPQPGEPPWPDPKYLRQGLRTKGWFLLRPSTIGFELWRHLNDFPPSANHPKPTSTTASPPSATRTNIKTGTDWARPEGVGVS